VVKLSELGTVMPAGTMYVTDGDARLSLTSARWINSRFAPFPRSSHVADARSPAMLRPKPSAPIGVDGSGRLSAVKLARRRG
jgi:hypothetical protein